MKKLFFLLLFNLFYCETSQNIQNPLKGSIENPIYIDTIENIETCLKKFEEKYKLKIHFIGVTLGSDMHILDKFEFPFSQWKKKERKQESSKEKFLIKIKSVYFYIDQYHSKDECKDNSIENLLEWE